MKSNKSYRVDRQPSNSASQLSGQMYIKSARFYTGKIKKRFSLEER